MGFDGCHKVTRSAVDRRLKFLNALRFLTVSAVRGGKIINRTLYNHRFLFLTNAEQRRMDLEEERKHRIVTTLHRAWEVAQVANEKGYGSREDEEEAYKAYKRAVEAVKEM